MDTRQISDALEKIYSDQNRRIVFWYDGEKEFEEMLPALQLENVAILRLDQQPQLALKIKLEMEDPDGKYLLYAPHAEPVPEDDWLFDIRLYSYSFHADQSSIFLKDLNLETQSLRPYMKQRSAFLRSQERLNRLKKWVSPDDGEEDMDLKMLAVVTRADHPDPFAVLMCLLSSFCDQGRFDGDAQSKIWLEMEKLELLPAFWNMMARTFGYVNEASPGIMDLLLRLFATDFIAQLNTDPPSSLAHFVISGNQSLNSSVFLAQWRANSNHCGEYRQISKAIGEKLKIEDVLLAFDEEPLLEVMTFEAVERRIISSLRDRIVTNLDTPLETIESVVRRRLDGFWTQAKLGEDGSENLYRIVYHALVAAMRLFELQQKYPAGFTYATAQEMFAAYCEELFGFDQHYRKFHELADKAEKAGWDVLKKLQTTVEERYSGWYMEKLGLTWSDLISSKENSALLAPWRFSSATGQHAFFETYVSPVLEQNARNRIFVIISDGFRYEAAEELAHKINRKYRFKAELSPMLGVLPSYTALGMAALLPHKQLSFKKSKSAEVLVDGKPCASFDQRCAILSAWEGTAVKADDLLAMSKEHGREFVKPHRLIYIYHDRIDATGDKAASESNTFGAVRKTMEDIHALIKFIINSLNGTKVVVTADHGFIYQEKGPEAIDKSRLEHDTKKVLKSHKRFVLGKNLGQPKNLLAGNTHTASGTETEMEFLLPKGTNRFHFVGGARYFHGGAMLQEIVIPVVSISEMKGKHRAKSEIREVNVSLLGSYKKLVTNRPVYKLIQTDPVSERIQPKTLKISLRDGGELISNEEIITFDSDSDSMDARQKSVRLALKKGSYDNKKEYFLVMRNMDDTEYDRIPIIIDIAFANDF